MKDAHTKGRLMFNLCRISVKGIISLISHKSFLDDFCFVPSQSAFLDPPLNSLRRVTH